MNSAGEPTRAFDATSGPDVTITSDSEVVGVTLVPDRPAEVLGQFVVAGKATSPSVDGPVATPVRRDDAAIDVAAALAVDRGQERW